MEDLIRLLLDLIQKVPYLSEADKEDATETLRRFEAHVGVEGVVPPAPGATNAPVEPPPAVEPPGPVAEPVPPNEQPPVPTSPEVADTAPEATNAFSGVDPNAPPA
jgi:hypothetical protein